MLLLISYAERRERVKDINTKNKTLWEEISDELKKKGVFFAPKACDTKMKNLKRSYVACVDHNKVSGNDRKKCNLYDELHEIFSRDDAIQPKRLCSTLDGPVKRCKDAVKNAENCSSTGSDIEEAPVVKSKKKKLPAKKKEEDFVGLFAGSIVPSLLSSQMPVVSKRGQKPALQGICRISQNMVVPRKIIVWIHFNFTADRTITKYTSIVH